MLLFAELRLLAGMVLVAIGLLAAATVFLLPAAAVFVLVGLTLIHPRLGFWAGMGLVVWFLWTAVTL